uniref:Uncharacterized protein n=1 Tax=Ditylenchus dipsaci TaxID=166011 RepID=A0A915DVR0_9BILA
MASEFNESDVSDNDYEEAQSSSGDEYEEEDDYRIGGNSVVPCGKQSYEHFWTSEAPRIPVDVCQPDAMPIGPVSVYESEEDAFAFMFIPSKKAKFGIKIFCLVDPAYDVHVKC